MDRHDLSSTHIAGVFAATSTLSAPQPWLMDWANRDGANDTGVPVTAKSSIGLPAIWYCVNRIAGVIGMLPLELFEKQGADSTPRELPNDPAAFAMDSKPNEVQTPFVFRSTLQTDALLHGAGRALIVRSGRGQAVELLRMPPEYTCTVAVGPEDESRGLNYYWQGFEKYHVIRWPDRQWDVYSDRDVLHVYRFSLDGLSGCGIVNYAKNAVGEGLAAQKYAAKTYKSGAKPSLVLVAPAGMFRTEPEAKQFLDDFNKYHAGTDNAGKAGLLREGMKPETISMTAQEIQAIEQRQYNRQEIMLLFGIESIPGDNDSESYNSREERANSERTHTYGPWMCAWEQEAKAKILTERQRATGRFYFQFNDWELLKPSAAARGEFYSKMIASRVFNPNYARKLEGLPPYEGGEEYMNPAIDQKPKPNEPAPKKESAGAKAVRARIVQLVTVEANRVTEAAGKPGNYVEWLNKFYSKWADKLGEAVNDLGGLPSDAADHAAESRELILRVAGEHNQDAFPLAVKLEVTKWPARAEALANKILELEQ